VSFCQICRHPVPGHEMDCPVKTGEAQRGYQWPYGINPQDMQPLNQIQQQLQGQMGSVGALSVVCRHCGGLNGMHQWAGEGPCPGASENWSQYVNNPLGGYSNTQILSELASLRDDVRVLTHMVGELLARK
jgi:hypothetical protein